MGVRTGHGEMCLLLLLLLCVYRYLQGTGSAVEKALLLASGKGMAFHSRGKGDASTYLGSFITYSC